MNTIADFWAKADAVFWIGLLFSFLLGYVTNVVSGPHSNRFREWVSGDHLRKLLKLNGDDVIVVLPHQVVPSDRRLPQLAVEDVLALRNVFEILAELGIKHPKIRHPENLADPDRKKNLISIGGSSRNAFTREILEQPINGDVLAFVASPSRSNQVELRRGNTMTYSSPSYEEAPTDEPRAASKDVAFILRRPNPKNDACSVVVLAGIRGIGTWGASDHLRKYAKKLAARVHKDQGNAVENGFLAVIDVEYKNFDIVHSKVKDVTSVANDA